MRSTLLIDADILIFRVAISCERAICWDEERELWSLHADMTEAKSKVQDEIATYVEVLGGKDVILCFSNKPTFRHEMYPEYKANRPTRKPTIYGPLRDWAKETWRSEAWPMLEADDVMGVLAKSHCIPSPKIVVSDDKDMQSIPCSLFQPMHPEKGVRRITYEQAKRFHLLQTLTGDSTDNYPGLPGVGPKKAEGILKENTWKEVVDAYEAKGLSEQDALLQARLAQILTPSLYDQHTGKVKKWIPPKQA
jgi:DNA polymerase-1